MNSRKTINVTNIQLILPTWILKILIESIKWVTTVCSVKKKRLPNFRMCIDLCVWIYHAEVDLEKKGQDVQKCKCSAFGLMYIVFGFISGILSPFGAAVIILLRKLCCVVLQVLFTQYFTPGGVKKCIFQY
jgi:hypothetical protein